MLRSNISHPLQKKIGFVDVVSTYLQFFWHKKDAPAKVGDKSTYIFPDAFSYANSLKKCKIEKTQSLPG